MSLNNFAKSSLTEDLHSRSLNWGKKIWSLPGVNRDIEGPGGPVKSEKKIAKGKDVGA